MTPTVHYADPDAQGALEEDDDPEALPSELSIDSVETASASGALKDGRRRNSRLRGKDTGDENFSVVVVEEAFGSWRKGRRKLDSAPTMDSSAHEVSSKSEDSGASPSAATALVPCTSASSKPHVNGDQEDAKVKATAMARFLVDTKGDFCDSNIFGDLQSIVNLHPDENGMLNETRNEAKLEGVSEVTPKKEVMDHTSSLEVIGQATRLRCSKGDGKSEAKPVVSDPQEEDASRGSTSKVREFDVPNGSDGMKEEYLESRVTAKITSDTSCLQSDGEGIFQLGKKSDSLKSVNQEVGVSDGDGAGTLKVESSVELTRSYSRQTGNTAGGEDDSSGVTEGEDNTSGEKVDESVSINSKAGWVKCDDCNKWRSIPVELAEKIGDTNAYWSCKENPNKCFADCSIPQVKSNEEINKDLGISESSSCDEEDDVEATCDSKPTYSGRQTVTMNGRAIWKEIKRNIFKHRKQKHQDADEAMVCQCAPPKPGEVGCGEDCLNRMLNVECLPQMCPCGSLCTNQQFQKRDYAKVELFRCGKKGHGLQAKERIPRGSFVIEYVGEVLDMPSFEARQKEYSMNSQKHFYFMTLSANEVIDACSKGNYGRFINHSCDPNCKTEKWMVDGEVCIGLFAIRDVEKGEEITFDYNFVRVGGADAKKCECGATKCRGFIGVDPDTPQNVLEIDSDDGEDPEPIMIQADSDDDEPEDYLDKAKAVAKKARMMTGSESIYESSKLGVKRKFYSSGARDVKTVKRSRRVKTAASSKIVPHKAAPPRLFSGSRFGARITYYSDVESKLGELTNESGELRKQRDTAKQYLKLLVLTAASGGNANGAAACSARDLSMLLEALLKTQKSSLLKDIMNKNGLQMFHNLIKQFRKSFEKRPILRKLLKVLDHLAKRRVLTVDLIYSPPRSGTECFTDTLFDLSRHDDIEVQTMARNFRKLHVPPRPPKPQTTPLPLPSLSPSPSSYPQASSSAPPKPEQPPAAPEEGDSQDPSITSRRKRPSRWDTVTETPTPPQPPIPKGGPPPPAAVVRPPMPPGRPPPVRPHQGYPLYMYPPGVQPQVYPPVGRPMHLGMPPMPGGLHPYAMGRGQVPPYLMHPLYPAPPFPPPAPPLPPPSAPPLPPTGCPSWPRPMNGFSGCAPEAPPSEGQVKQGDGAFQSTSSEPGESEPSVPGLSPARPARQIVTSGASASTQGSVKPLHEVGSSRAEETPHAHRCEPGTKTHGHDANVVSRSRNVTENREAVQQGYFRPEGSHGRVGEREMSWDTPECSSFHHHVSGMIRARVEKKRMVHYKDLEKFCSKLTEVVTRKEIKKYRENKTQGMQKVILRSKLLEKVDAYVDLQIAVYRKLKSGEGQS